MRPLDAAVLEALERYLLDPGVVARVVDETLSAVNLPRGYSEADALRDELQTLEAEIARLSDAVAAGGHLVSLLDALKAREARRGEVRAALATVAALVRTAPTDRAAIQPAR